MTDVGSGWLKALELRGPTAFLAFVAAALVSVGHERSWMSLAELPAWSAAAANLCAILFGVLSLPWLLGLVGWPYRRVVDARRRNRRIVEALQSLSSEEAYVLFHMIADGRRDDFGNITGLYADASRQGLVNRGLLVPRAAVGSVHSLWIPDHVWKVVRGQDVGEQLRELEASAAKQGVSLPRVRREPQA